MMSGYNPMAAGLGSLGAGLFTDAGAPYQAAMAPFNQYMGQATGAQNPFYQAGTGAINNYQNWLGSMQNPSGFINDQMKNYQVSPWAQYQQQQATRAAQNMGSAEGLTGSSPLMLQAQQNSQNISSQDMQNWLQNVLGINTQYGSGMGNLMGQGANAANQLSNLYSQQGIGMGNLAAGQQAGQNQNVGNIWGGIGSLASMFI